MKMYGWAGKRLKVYLDEGKIVEETLPREFAVNYLGGQGFNTRTLFDEVAPGIDPLGPENVLIVSTGPLAGTAAPAMSRWTVTAKAPLTGIYGDGNGGGDFAAELKFAGYDQIIFYGKSPRPVYLWINDGQAQLRDASHLWGKFTRETHYSLVKELGDPQIREICIGPAGENLVRYAKIMANLTRAGGKCGMGAVMGSKKLKAVVVRGRGAVSIARPEEFSRRVHQVYKKLMQSPQMLLINKTGTLYLSRLFSMKRAAPVRNAQSGYFEDWEKLTSEAFEKQYAVKHTACFSCPVACSHYYRVQDGKYKTHGCSNQWGTLYPFTFKCGSSNLAASLLLTTLCDQFGLDTHTCGATIAFAMEAWQRGLISAADTDGLILEWGNDDAVIELVKKIGRREGFGALLAEGSRLASSLIPGSNICRTDVKGLECSSFYPGEKEGKIVALGFATAPIGGSIHRGAFMHLYNHPRVREALGEKAGERLRDPDVYEGQGVLLAVENDWVAALNAVEACLFIGADALNEDDLAMLVTAATGVELDGPGLLRVGERIFNLERAFNVREGIRRCDDTLPEKFFGEKVTEYGITGIDREKFQKMLDEYYQFRGWDEDGVPTAKKLAELGLDDVIGKM